MTRLFQRLLKNGSIFFFLAGFSILLVYSAVRAPAPEFASETIVEFPRQDEETIRTRRANRPYSKRPAPVALSAGSDESDTGPVEPDPILRGLRAIPKSSGMMVLEANAIKHSWIFDALEGCIDFQDTDLPEGFPEDFDLTESIDRVATGDGVALVSGFFEGIDWEAAAGEPTEIRDGTKIYEASEGNFFAIWDNQMMITADSQEALDEVLNGLMNPESVPATGGLDANDAYGDIYGKFNGAVMQQMVPEEYQDQLTPELLETLQSVDFHVDTSQGLAMSAQVHSDDEETLKALNFVMKLALSQAKNSMVDMANEEFPSEALGLAQALQASKIGPAADGTLNFDLALPRDVMESFLREACTRVQETDIEDEEVFVEPDDASVVEVEPFEEP